MYICMQVERQKQAAKRKRAESQSGAGGKLQKRQKGAKREWWETGEPGDSEQDDDVEYYTKEVRPDDLLRLDPSRAGL